MPAIASLFEPIADDLRRVCEIFDRELDCDVPIVNELCAHVRQFRGKMLRPALVLLAGKACGDVRDAHLCLAAVVEMVHMATLVHDDVLDEGDLRRGAETINHMEGNEAALLLGDYLLSHAFHLCSSLDSQFASRTIAATAHVVCAGELQQVDQRGNLGLDVDAYMDIIRKKTAWLTRACCLLGAHYAGADAPRTEEMALYGLEIGVAFQITDDVLDIIGSQERVGKTLGRDLAKGKLTLPLIHHLQQVDGRDRADLEKLLADGKTDRKELRRRLETTGSLDFALQAARQHVESAINRLKGLPASDAADTLANMARAIVDRDM